MNYYRVKSLVFNNCRHKVKFIENLQPKQILLIVICAGSIGYSGCFQGRPSEQPPIHLNPNMDNQPKYKALGESKFFEDRSNMRMPVAGTVARGDLNEDAVYYTGKDANGNLVEKSPFPVTQTLLERGRERYDIYCTPCHSRVGDGTGVISTYNYVPPGNLHEERLVFIQDGHLYDVITNGIRNMPAYNHQIPVADRWAIVGYIRALQRSQNASLEDIPESERIEIR